MKPWGSLWRVHGWYKAETTATLRRMMNVYTTPHRVYVALSFCAAFLLACGTADEGETSQPSSSPNTDAAADTDPNLIDGRFWPGTGWKSSSAESLGLDQTGLDRARDYAFAPGRNTQALLVVYQGQLVGEWYAQGFSKDSMATSWSVAKSFLSVLYGIAMDQGDLATLDEPVGQWIPEWADDARGAITLRQLLQMQSGLDSSTEDMFSAADQLAYSLDRQLDTFPTWEYANGDSMILGYLLEVITGTDFETYAQENLLQPLGMTSARWWTDPVGQAMAWCCLDATPRDFARFGIMAARMGLWRDQRIVSNEFLDEAYTPQDNASWYGLHWWTLGQASSRVISALGYNDQLIYVMPEADLTVLRFGIYEHVGGDSYRLGFGNYMSTQSPSSWDGSTFLGYIDQMLVGSQ